MGNEQCWSNLRSIDIRSIWGRRMRNIIAGESETLEKIQPVRNTELGMPGRARAEGLLL